MDGEGYRHSYSQNHIAGNARVHLGDVIQHVIADSGEAEKDQKCHQTFKTTAYEEHKNINPDRVTGTCQWLLKHSQYHQWSVSLSDDLLWISADPGCGKSVLAKSLVDGELCSSAEQVVCYFFFKDTEEQDNLSNALCAIIHQIFAQQPGLIQHAKKAWKDSGDKITKDLSQLWRIWMNASRDAEAQNVICVLDALDECRNNDRVKLIEMLTSFYTETRLLSSQPTRVKFLVTSRPYDDIQYYFGRVPKEFPEIRLRGEDENDTIHAEINLVIEMRVKDLAAEFNLSQAVAQRLGDTLINMEHRTYLWLYLAIGAIREEYRDSLHPHLVTITTLPKSVEGAYNRILARIEKGQQPRVMQILEIIVGARRALKVEELALALGMTLSTDAQHLKDIRIDTTHLRKQLRQWCALFVFINHGRVYLIHQTAKEFLLRRSGEAEQQTSHWSHSLDPKTVELHMTQLCTRYLLLRDFVQERITVVKAETVKQDDESKEDIDLEGEVSEDGEDVEDEQTRLERQPHVNDFFRYSAEHWPSHLNAANLTQTDPFMHTILRLFDTTQAIFQLWFSKFWQQMNKPGKARRFGRLQAAAIIGHEGLVAFMLSGNPDQGNAKDEDKKTALKWACELGFEKVASVLLEHGTNVNVQEPFPEYELFGSMAFYFCVHIIIGAPISDMYRHSASISQSETSTHAAAREGHLGILKLLLKHNAKLTSQRSDGFTALHLACINGHLSMVKMILKDLKANGDQWTYVDKRGRTALHYLLQYNTSPSKLWYDRYQEIASLLLRYSSSADINIQDNEGVSAFHLALKGNDIAMVKKMLDMGARHDLGDNEKQLPVHYIGKARWWVATDVVRLALESFHQSNDKILSSDLEQSPLHIRKLRAVTALQQRDSSGQTPLHVAVWNKAYSVVAFILQYDADITIRTDKNRTALDLAFDIEHQSIKDLLLTISEKCGPSGVHTASCSGDTSGLECLLAQDKKSVNLAGERGRTPLHYSALAGNVETLKILLDYGADGSLRDAFGQTALHVAAATGQYDFVRFLLEGKFRGRNKELCNPNIMDRSGQTSLHLAADGGHVGIALLLIEAGADTSKALATGITPLYRAAYWNHVDFIELLLQCGATPNGMLPWDVMNDQTRELLQTYLLESEAESENDE